MTGTALDVGAGTGRDAAGLVGLGFDVIAVEPSARMREEARRLHADPRIRWIDDALPDLEVVNRLGMAFDLVLVSAVWMHLSQSERSRAFRKLILLLRPSGLLVMTVRHGPLEPGRSFHEVPEGELENLAKNHGAEVIYNQTSPDQLGRMDVTWSHLAIRLPDDGTGALPLLRHIILKSDKSSTYKLGLLRTIARIADGAQGMAHFAGEEFISVPLGLAALIWLRLYKPLIKAELPQTPSNRGTSGLGFVGPSFSALSGLLPNDLRTGMTFPHGISTELHQSIKKSVETIVKNPAHYITFPGTTDPIFKIIRKRSEMKSGPLFLDERYLRSFGDIFVPIHIWRALSRYDAWIEPALIGEWIRLMKSYAEAQGQNLNLEAMYMAMEWSDPNRDVSTIRKIALELLDKKRLSCVWTGKDLTAKNLDVDHCFPWSAWPCDDLWNLMPADRKVNQGLKRNRLPSAQTIENSAKRIMDWWNMAYLPDGNPFFKKRFFVEASGTLPLGEGENSIEKVFDALSIKRINLRRDQGIEEWNLE